MSKDHSEKHLSQHQRQIMQQSVDDAKSRGSLSTDVGEFGLSAIESLITDKNDNTMIDLSTPNKICSTFTTPFPSLKGVTPSYYRVDSKELQQSKMETSSFKNLLIFFYMFYVMVGEEAQMKGAEALMQKKWQYSKKYGKWVLQSGDGWVEFDVEKWCIQPAIGFNPTQAEFMTL
ncbi:hypothetical protein QTN25_004601 [Entamoeba marina]